MVSSSESGHSHWSVHSGSFFSSKASPVAKLPLGQAGRGPLHSPQSLLSLTLTSAPCSSDLQPFLWQSLLHVFSGRGIPKDRAIPLPRFTTLGALSPCRPHAT